MRERARIGLASAWIAVVVVRFFVPPPPWLDEIGATPLWLRVAELPLLATGLFATVVALARRPDRDGEPRLAFDPLRVLAAFVATLALELAYLLLWRAPNPSLTASLAHLSGLAATIATALAFAAFLTLTAAVAGRRCLRLSGIDVEDPACWISALAIGAIALALGAFGLAAIGQLHGIAVLVLLLGLAAVGAPEWRAAATLARRRISIPASFGSLSLWSGWVLLLGAALTFGSLLRATPVGWDDLTAYMARAQQIAGTGQLVAGGAAYPVELLHALGFAVGRTLGFPASPDFHAQLVAWWGGGLALLSIAWLGRIVRDWATGVVAAAVFATTPFVIQLSSSDLKVDSTLCAFLALALASVLRWREGGACANRWLGLAGAFLGFAVSIKPTAAFVVLALGVVIARDWIRDPGRRSGFARDGAAATALGLALVLPWLALHVVERGGRIEAVSDLLLGFDADATHATTLVTSAGHEPGAGPRATGLAEERGRYLGYDGTVVERMAWLPFAVTFGRNVGGFHAGVGFLYLALLPICWLFSATRGRDDPHGQRAALGWFAGVHLAAWCVLSQGIPWYGIAMFAAFAVLVADFALTRRGPARRLIALLLFVSYAIGVLAQMERFPRLIDPAFASGMRDREASIRARFPGMLEIADQIEADPAIHTGDARVLRVGTMLPYFIAEPRSRLVDDTHLDQWNAIDALCQRSDACTLASLRRAGIRYVVYDASTPSIDQTPGRTLVRKADRFAAFAGQSLVLRHADERSRIALFEVPPAR